MKRLIKFFMAVLLSVTMNNAGHAAEDPANGALRVGGSTTLLPIISTAASDFMEKYGTWNKVDPALPAKPVVIFVSGGGSGFGIKSAINGTVHIGLASRRIKSKEENLLGDHKSYLVGMDAVVIAVNENNPLAEKKSGFSLPEVASLFSGETDSYRDFDQSLPDQEIVLFVRDSGAGSAEMLQKLFMGKKQISPKALQLPSQGALVKKLETNTSGIGYLSSGLVVNNPKLKTFALKGVAPTNDNVISGKYPFVRPLLMVVKGSPGPMARHFIDYVLNEGQSFLVSNNYVPARSAGIVAK